MREYTIACGTIKYTCPEAVWRELEYLARWRADLAYIAEHFGPDDPEADVSRKSIVFAFEQLDRLGCPFWLQNCAVSYGTDWREYKRMHFSGWLSDHGYVLATA